MDINNSKIVICWGYSPTIANNSTATKTLPYTYTTTYIPIATHYWSSGECAWNHVVMVGKINVSTIQFRQARIINSDTASLVASYITMVINNGFIIGFGRVNISGTSSYVTVPITLEQHRTLVVSQYNGGTAGFHIVQGYFENISRIQVRVSQTGTPSIAFMYIGS